MAVSGPRLGSPTPAEKGRGNHESSKCLIPSWSPLLVPVSPPPLTYHDCAILGATGNDIIIVRAPGNVQHGSCVATDHWHILVHTSSLEGTEGPLREVLLPSKLSPAPTPCPFREAQRRRMQDPWEAEQVQGGKVWSSVCLRPELSGKLRRAGHRKHRLGVRDWAGGPCWVLVLPYCQTLSKFLPSLPQFFIRALGACTPTTASLGEASMANRPKP